MAEMVLDRLRELQEADLQLRSLRQKKASHDRAAKVRASQIQKYQGDIEALRTRHKKARAAVDAKELDVRQKRADIERLRGQQLQVKDNRQFQALQNEIRFAELSITKFEDEILADYADIEAIAAQIREAEQEVARQQHGLGELKKQIEDKKSEVDAEIDACHARRELIADALPPKVVEQFNRIADRLDGEALAPVIRDEDEGTFMCGGCNMSVTQNTYVVLAGHGDTLVTCPNCTRILYLEAP